MVRLFVVLGQSAGCGCPIQGNTQIKFSLLYCTYQKWWISYKTCFKLQQLVGTREHLEHWRKDKESHEKMGCLQTKAPIHSWACMQAGF